MVPKPYNSVWKTCAKETTSYLNSPFAKEFAVDWSPKQEEGLIIVATHAL